MKLHGLIIALVVALSLGCNSHNGGSGATTSAVVVEKPTALPNVEGSVKFLILGDWGTARRGQYDLANQMAKLRQEWQFDRVITAGDNLYGLQRPSDYKLKFETPYKALLKAGVKFYASLGNHDAREQVNYKLFNMEGKFYYTLDVPEKSVRFYILDTTYPTPEQLDWLKKELEGSREGQNWRIAVFHHPLYSSGGRHGSDLKLREAMEELFVQNMVSVVFQGHDHFYERVKPQRGIVYFVVGSGGKVAVGDVDPNSGLSDKAFDTALAFLAVEIADDKMYFNAITQNGNVVDSGIIERRIELEKKQPEEPKRGATPPSTQSTPQKP
jgi:3',5'-cyclic AMP phosphodiesterase CpdA